MKEQELYEIILMQQRSALALTKEGQDQIKNELAVLKAIALDEQREANRFMRQQTPEPAPAEPASSLYGRIVDPAVMTEEEMQEWLASLQGLAN